MAFKAEELASKIFPEPGAERWAACPQDTLGKGGKNPCPENTRACPENTSPPGGRPCPQDTLTPPPHKPPKKAGEIDGDALALLQAQLRGRLAQGPVAAGL